MAALSSGRLYSYSSIGYILDPLCRNNCLSHFPTPYVEAMLTVFSRYALYRVFCPMEQVSFVVCIAKDLVSADSGLNQQWRAIAYDLRVAEKSSRATVCSSPTNFWPRGTALGARAATEHSVAAGSQLGCPTTAPSPPPIAASGLIG